LPPSTRWGVGEQARGHTVYAAETVMHDALDETLVGRIPSDEAFRARFANPYAVIHRADVRLTLLEGCVRARRWHCRCVCRRWSST
jgi:hypothetical protein